MTKEQQIAALTTRLGQVDSEIQQLQVARDASTNPQERADLAAEISARRAARETILQAINNLQTSGDVSAHDLGPAGAGRRVAALDREDAAAERKPPKKRAR